MDLMEYAKYEEFMNSYEDELYELYTDHPEEYRKLKIQLENKRYDVDSDERIFLAAMEATEFYARINDEEHVERTPLLKKLAEIENQ